MKIINYIVTASGNKIAASITEAFIDPLETKNTALEAVKKQPEYKELQARISAYDRYVSGLKKDGVKLGRLSAIPEHIQKELKIKLSNVKSQQARMYELQNQAMEDNPVYLIPNGSFLVGDNLPEKFINQVNDSDDFVKIISVDNGEIISEVISNNLGKKYRLPETLDWIVVYEPDHVIPVTAVYEEPGPEEVERIECIRISSLSKGEKYDEAASVRDHAERAYLDALILADLEDKEEDVEARKDVAKKTVKQAYKDIEKKYGVKL